MMNVVNGSPGRERDLNSVELLTKARFITSERPKQETKHRETWFQLLRLRTLFFSLSCQPELSIPETLDIGGSEMGRLVYGDSLAFR